jgi:hypothetical protein
MRDRLALDVEETAQLGDDEEVPEKQQGLIFYAEEK